MDRHSFQWVVDREATEETTGLKHEECTVCGYTRNENTVIDQLDHELTFHPMVEATCVQAGNVAYYSCANCNRNYADKEASQLLTDVIIPVDPDHHTGETDLKNAVEATCTQNGYTGDLYCADCGEKIQSGTVILATGHSLEQMERKEPTHFAPGYVEHWQCTACHALFADQEGLEPLSTEDVVLPQIPHSFGEDWAHDNSGHWHVCSCGVKNGMEDHTFGEWATIKEATETAAGIRERVCTQCGYVESQITAPLTPETNGASQPGEESPRTGEDFPMVVYLAVMMLAGAGSATLVLASRKRQENR